MKELEFKIDINAPASIVWKALWEEENYKKWTNVFCEGSYAESDWKEGSKILFLMPKGEGMYSKITTLVPYQKMYFSHIGEIKNFEEQPLTEATKQWSGARENYTLSESDNVTTVTVNMDILESHYDYFATTFPKGLEFVKQTAESLLTLQ
jgi:uncharacterized protein YndB with AHSA1/START domain